jgi:hypothetical protein
LTSFRNDDDVTVTSSTKSKEIHVSNSTPENNNPLEEKTTVIVAVMRGKPKEVTTAIAVTSTTKRN